MPDENPPEQLELFAEPAEPAAEEGRSRLLSRLQALLPGRTVELTLTDNLQRIASVRPIADGLSAIALRLDRSFLRAPDEVLSALIRWVTGRARDRRRHLNTIRQFFTQARPAPERRTQALKRAPRLIAQGEAHDLDAIYGELSREHFDNRLDASITWGRRPAAAARTRSLGKTLRGGRSSIRLGSYSYASNLIRIHPALDHSQVPRYVVAAVVFHEMLHASMPQPTPCRGRRSLHPPEFYQAEQSFPAYQAASLWLEQNLDWLLKRC
ncbi:MAG TPA: hypothetical protein PK413_12070 [Thermoanaerobaculia bacterium]|nr:hypothetical protein [Thermoanaerobaculia bacterium]